MISDKQLIENKEWFRNYVENFYINDKPNAELYKIKYDHSLRVCEEIRDIGMHCGLSNSELNIAEFIALYHDLGRFEQYHKFKTFTDHKSINHSFLAIKILKQHKLLADFDGDLINLIYTAIENHNTKDINHKVIGMELFYAKLLRDADKVDILRVVTNYYDSITNKNNAIELDLPDLPEIEEQNFLDIESGKLISKENLRTLNDFKLMQISWLFDLNFERSFEIIKDKCYIDKIFNVLPQNDKIRKLKVNVMQYLNESVMSR